MKKFLFCLLVLGSVVSFSNCDLKADKLVGKVITKKLTYSKNDNLAFMNLGKEGMKYKYAVLENHSTHTVNRAFLELDMSKGIVYQENIADDTMTKIYEDKSSICK